MISKAQTFQVELSRDLSSENADFCPRLIGENGQYMMFTSNRVNKDLHYTNLYYATKNNAKWDYISELIKKPGTTNYGAITMDYKRKVAFFNRCPQVRGKVIGCQIYYSFMEGGMIGEAMPVPFPLDFDITPYQFGHPYFSNELDILIFASSVPGGYGGKDIWFSKYDRKTDSWSKPKNLGPEINTAKDEMYPFIDLKGTLYFSSDGHAGLGELDIFKSVLLDSLIWSKPKNLGGPLNSEKDDFGIDFDKKEMGGYFSSNRSGGLGGDDIYKFIILNPDFKSLDVKRDTALTKIDNSIKQALTSIFNKDNCLEEVGTLCVSKLKVIPNPNNGVFDFEFYCNKDSNLKIRFYSSSGQLLSVEESDIKKGTTAKPYDLKNIAKGIYYISILFGCEIMATEKVIIE